MPNRFFLFLSICVFLSTTACKKEAQIIVKTVTKTDTLIVKKTDTLRINNFLQDTATTFILVRHAETDKTFTDPDPVLNAKGLKRANDLKRTLNDVALNTIYSTNFFRTKQTIEPTVTHKGLKINIYDATFQSQFIDSWIKDNKGKAILIAGHAHTIPNLVNLLAGTTQYKTITDTIHNNLFIVTTSKKGNGKVLQLKYGD